MTPRRLRRAHRHGHQRRRRRRLRRLVAARTWAPSRASATPRRSADFFRLEEYEGHTWIGHNRFPTNTPGWWGGAHPFTLLDWVDRAQRRDLELRHQQPLPRAVRLPAARSAPTPRSRRTSSTCCCAATGCRSSWPARCSPARCGARSTACRDEERELAAARCARSTARPCSTARSPSCSASTAAWWRSTTASSCARWWPRARARSSWSPPRRARMREVLRRARPGVGAAAGEPVIARVRASTGRSRRPARGRRDPAPSRRGSRGVEVADADDLVQPEFRVRIDDDRASKCGRCVQQCGWGVYTFDERPLPDDSKCRACHRCVTLLPGARITIEQNDARLPRERRTGRRHCARPSGGRPRPAACCSPAWATTARTSASSTTSCSTRARSPTPPSTRCASRWSCAPTWAASRTASSVEAGRRTASSSRRTRGFAASIQLDTPIIFAPMSYGSVSLNVHKSLAMAAERLGILMNTGEGGLHADLYPYAGQRHRAGAPRAGSASTPTT